MDIKSYQLYFAKGFGQFVRNACEKQQITAAELGRKTGLSRSYCGKLMSTTTEPPQPTITTVHVICNALGFEGAKLLYALEMNLKKSKDKPRVRAKVIAPPATKVVDVDESVEAYDLISEARL